VSQAGPSLLCPGCGQSYEAAERFCPSCRLPLTYDASEAQADPPSDLHRRARKVKPQLAEGRLVRVAGARNQAEAEFIQSLLLEEGVPSVLRRSPGFDVPDFLAAGPRDILVPESGAPTAREVLLQAELISPARAEATVRPVRLAAALIAALALGALIVWGALQLAA
jgi:hypothetical protein